MFHALMWAVAAWVAWVVAALVGGTSTWVALALTSSACIAVLGARRPGVGAWNFVVAAALAVLLLPLAETQLLGKPVRFAGASLGFLIASLAITVVYYLPTRLGPAAAVLGMGLGLSLTNDDVAGRSLIGAAPWVAWLSVLPGDRGSAADALWRAFRDRYGWVWSQRVRDQFNRAAANAGLACELSWTGLRGDGGATAPELLEGLMKRFVSRPFAEAVQDLHASAKRRETN